MSQIEQLIARHRVDIDKVQTGVLDELPDPVFEAFYEFYLNNREMPYGVAKARTGDPYQWVNARVLEDVKSMELF
jgi:hypothetical protein